MKYLVSAAEMRLYDSNTIEKIGIPACVLMERAALAAAETAYAHCKTAGAHVLVMAGMGNNGGDALAAARLLTEKGCRVEVWCVGDRQKASVQWVRQMEILEKYPVEFTETPGRQEYDVLLDGLFGVGLSREVSGAYAGAVECFNRLPGWKLALDLPSGVDSDTGKIWGCAVKADATVTFGFCKKGLVMYPGCEAAGEILTADIGISDLGFFGQEPEMFAYDEEVSVLMPKRDPGGNKATFGKLLLTAGSLNMAGAAVLAARGAYRTGAGMVKVITSPENRSILQQSVPEALLGNAESLKESLEWADILAIGPGLGKDKAALFCLDKMIREGRKPLLADADGLNLLAQNRELGNLLAAQGGKGRDIILTPHVKELAGLLGKSTAECKSDLPSAGRALARAFHAVVAAKDARTYICGEEGAVCMNLNGNSGMATAGSGDVLAGIIAGLMAQGMRGFNAASVGVYLHARAGDLAAARKGEYACMAGDIAENIALAARRDQIPW